MDIRRSSPARGLLTITALVALVGLIALPVLAADPSPSADPSSSAEPAVAASASAEASPPVSPDPSVLTPIAPKPTDAPAASSAPAASEAPKPTKAPKADKPAKGPEIDVTVTGVVRRATDADGEPAYTVAAGGTTYRLDAGPPWYWGDDHPLAAFVGKRVTIAGEGREGSDEIDVVTVDGTAIRAAGRPPWAGGWKRVGEQHPGWSQEKWDRWQQRAKDKAEAKGVDCWPPGHCKVPGGPASSIAPTH